jgi:hypothetical protein
VRALEPCLTGLPETSRKVLSLRAGLGTARPRSRRDVAGMTGFSLRRVGRVEAGALRRLKRLARTSGCAAAVTTDAFAATTGDAAGGAGLAGPGLTRSNVLAQDGSAARAPGIGVLSERESSAADGDADPAGGSGLGPSLPGVGPVPGGEVPVAVLIGIALGGAALTALLYRRTRRRGRWDPSEPW